MRKNPQSGNSGGEASDGLTSPSAFSALSAMERLCSVREYCETDIRKKLEKFDLSGQERDMLVEELKKNGFLSDARYAVAFVRDRVRFRGWGRNKIIFMLRSKKIEQSVIDLAIKEYPENSGSGYLKELLLKKSRTIREDSSRQECMAKLVRFALSRGFEYDEVLKEVNEIIDHRGRKNIDDD